MKMTARGRRQRRRDLTLDRDELALLGREPSDFGKQGLGVRVIGIGKKFRRRSRFDHAPEIHDQNAVADMAHDTEIVADKQVRQAEGVLEVHEEVQPESTRRARRPTRRKP